ncbi:MAG TPA: NUDIX domain-containing protein [Thermoanaerobaculia bacterium]|nr:NUDIX domain-containing protein [Thermoanaerobaculia bacterium]
MSGEGGSRPAGGAVVAPRNAASVILLRDAPRGPEVFMVERHASARFVGGAHVFPGGRVDPEDADAADLCAGLDDEEASRRLHLPQGGLAYYVAAIRECFEEAGVLLAHGRASGSGLTHGRAGGPGRAYGTGGRRPDETAEHADAELRELRRALNAGEVGFLELARHEDVRLATDRMHYWAHWITPEASPIRFDTRFFLSTVARDQAAAHHDAELAGSEWIRPAEALAKAESGEWTMILPTLRTLGTLLAFRNVAEAEEAGRRRREVATLEPRILRRPEGIQVVLPGDEGW